MTPQQRRAEIVAQVSSDIVSNADAADDDVCLATRERMRIAIDAALVEWGEELADMADDHACTKDWGLCSCQSEIAREIRAALKGGNE